MARKFVIDTDVGLDDASAIFMATKAHKSGVINILAVTAVHGNTSLDNVVNNIARTMKAADLNRIPIYKGTHVSVLEPVPNEDPFHGHDGFGNTVHDEEPDLEHLQSEHAVNALVRIAKENPGEITLVALGPLTNVALAMRLDVHFASNLKALYIMGGNTEGVGNITVSAEFNFHCDPEAAYIVLENTKCPTYIASWELCLHRAKIDWEWRMNVYGGIDSNESRLMNKIEAENNNKKHFEHYIVCDQIAMAAAIDSSCVTKMSQHFASVELSGRFTRGQMIVDYSSVLCRSPNVFLIDRIDMNLFKTMLLWSVNDPSVDYCPPSKEEPMN